MIFFKKQTNIFFLGLILVFGFLSVSSVSAQENIELNSIEKFSLKIFCSVSYCEEEVIDNEKDDLNIAERVSLKTFCSFSDCEKLPQKTEQVIKTFSGRDGVSGINGLNGVDGSNGEQGERGYRGTQGLKGEKGNQGIQGQRGPGGRGGRGADGQDATGSDALIVDGITAIYSSNDQIECVTDGDILKWDSINNYWVCFDANSIVVAETITTISLNTHSLDYKDENGATTSLDFAPYLDNTDNQNLTAATLTGNLLKIEIENGNPITVDLTNLVNDADFSITNEIQDLSLVANNLKITNNGGATTIDLSPYLDNTDDQKIDTFTLAANVLSISAENDGEAAKTVSLAAYLDNTDAQQIALASDTLTLSNGTATNTTVDLSSYIKNTESINELADVDTTTTVPTSNQVLAWNGTAWVPANATVDTDTQNLSISGHTISLVDGGSVVVPDNDTTYTAGTGLNLVGTVFSSLLGTSIDISDETNLAVGNGLTLTGDTLTLASATCSGTDKLQWNGTALICSTDLVLTEAQVDAYANNNGYLTSETDDQKIDVFSLVSNILSFSLENDGEATKTVSLAAYLDNTDTQDLSLSSNTLSLVDGGSVNLATYLDNTDTLAALSCSSSEIASWNGTTWICIADDNGTDDQNLTAASISTTNILTLGIQDGGGTTVDLSQLEHTGTTGSVFFAGTDTKPTEDNANLFWNNVNNRLGIGTNNPSKELDVRGSAVIDKDLVVIDSEIIHSEHVYTDSFLGDDFVWNLLQSNKTDDPNDKDFPTITSGNGWKELFPLTRWKMGDETNNGQHYGYIGYLPGLNKEFRVNTGGADDTDLALGTQAIDVVHITASDQKVGINTSNPDELLHIAGNMRLDGSFEDKDGDAGATGQVLSSTVTGTDWINAPSAGVAYTTGSGDPVTAGVTTGDWYRDTDDNRMYIWNGTSWNLVYSQESCTTLHSSYETSATFNVNTALFAKNMFATQKENDAFDGTDLTTQLSSTQVEVNYGGTYLISVNGTMVSTVQRANTAFHVYVNGVLQETDQDNYIRSNSGHNEASIGMSFEEKLSAGDIIEIRTDAQGAAGTVTLAVGAETDITLLNTICTDGATTVGGASAIPYITNTSSYIMPPSVTQNITITGTNFTPTSAVSIPGWAGSVNSVTIVSPTEIVVNVTSGTTTAFFDVVISNDGVLNTDWAGNGVNLIDVHATLWTDLRLGGDTFTDGNGAGNDIRYRAGMSMSRDVNGMSFTGSTPWSSWVKFESLGWTRGTNQTLQWVFTAPTSNMMIGIGSDATNETNTAQYQQAEVEAYFSSSTNLWGLYGNTGTLGTAGNQSNGSTISSSGVYKIIFENDGDAGDTFTIYQLPSAAPGDWDDVSNVISTFTIGGTLNPNETNIMPFIIPQSGGAQRFIAIQVN